MTGSRLLLSIFAAAVLGGLGSIPGAVLGAVMIGIGEELAVLVLPATYRSAVGFATILLILSLRPAGSSRGKECLMLSYLIFTLTLGGIYALLALSLNLIGAGSAWSI